MSRRWEPLLHGTDRDLALELTTTIATAVRDAPPMRGRGLMGTTGIAVFLAEAEAEGLGHDLGALGTLERGLAELAADRSHLGLWTGATGLRWAVSRLAAGDGATELLAHLDHAICARLDASPIDEYDLHSGVAGLLLAYAGDTGCGARIVARVLDHLEHIDLGRPRRSGFGCAHGIAGILSALACCRAHGCPDPRIRPRMLAIVGALDHLEVADQRIGWCRGESGIALALLGAARALDREDLARKAVEVALAPFARDGGRWPADPGLCHGAAGLAHLYNRLYQATGDGRLAEHARTWLRTTIAMGSPGERIWEADASLLAGAAGVGLALLGGATSTAPTWDRILGADICGLPDRAERPEITA